MNGFIMRDWLRHEKNSYEANVERELLLEDFGSKVTGIISDYIGGKEITNIKVNIDNTLESLENSILYLKDDKLSVLVPRPSRLYGELSNVDNTQAEYGLNFHMRRHFNI